MPSTPAIPERRSGGTAVHLPALIAFECVARHLNFSRAATELAVTPTAVSKTIKQLEAQIGIRLFNRTTRSVSLTESGNKLLDTLAPALEQIRHSVRQVGAAAQRPYGLLRINTSYVAYASLIEPRLPGFLERYPEIQLEVSLDNALSDIVTSGFDAGIRLGDALQRDMIGIPLGPPQKLVVVAAPAYLQQHGAPQRPQDLLGHDCIRQRLSGQSRFLDWEFREGRKPFTIDVSGRLIYDEMRSVVGAACRGGGLAYVFQQFVAAELAAGDLVALLERHSPAVEMFHLYYPNRAQMPGKLRAFIDFFQAADGRAA